MIAVRLVIRAAENFRIGEEAFELSDLLRALIDEQDH